MGRLELRQDPFGLRHYLDGVAVRSGARLLLLLEGGQLIPGQYEWTFDETPPTFFLCLGGEWEQEAQASHPRGPQVVFEIPDEAVFVWPEGTAPPSPEDGGWTPEPMGNF